MGYAKPSMTTIFDLESVSTNDLPAALNDAYKAALLARYVVEGLICKSAHSVVDDDDLNLVQEAIYAAGAHIFQARRLHEDAMRAATDGPLPPGVVPIRRPKGEPA